MNGVRVDPVTRQSFCKAVDDLRACGESHIVQFLAADPSVIAMDDPAYRSLLNGAHLNIADGFPVAAGLRLQGVRTERIPGTEGMKVLLSRTRRSGPRHFFYGGTDAVRQQLVQRLTSAYSDIVIAGTESPPFRPLSNEDFIATARSARQEKTDLLWIGLGTPKQHVAAEQLAQLNAAPVILCVGAAFDFVAGVKRRAPLWMQHTGTEWIHRLATEPRRLWRRYLIGNPRFLVGYFKESLRTHGDQKRFP